MTAASVQPDEVFRSFRENFGGTVGSDDVGVFDTDCTEAGDNEFGLNGYDGIYMGFRLKYTAEAPETTASTTSSKSSATK